MKMKVLLIVLCALAAGLAGAQTASLAWMQKGAQTGYQVQASGDAASAQGAKARVTAVDEDTGKSGVAMAVSDAAPFRGRVVKFAANLSTHDAEKGATIFLQVFANTQDLGFITSDTVPVLGDATQVHREIQIAVPSVATRISYGIVLHGKGTVNADEVRLVAGDPIVEVPPKDVLDKAIQVVRDYALNTGKIDWASVEPRIRAMAADAKVSQQVYPAIRALLAELGDHHSYLREPSLTEFLNTEGGPALLPVIEMKPHGVGYISMPGYSGRDPQAWRSFADQMVQSISKLAPQVRCGWVVDLRSNTGGAIAPMLAGLGPLLGDAPLGAFRHAQGQVDSWKVGYGMPGYIRQGPDLSKSRVAVLTGEQTASSGEIAAVAFRGRAHTRSFGAPTAGLSTANADFPLPDGSMIILTTAMDLDRNGHAYGDKIQPDQRVETTDSKNDAVLDAAEDWLAETGRCARR
jgi:carboxyl-terminal processing protease